MTTLRSYTRSGLAFDVTDTGPRDGEVVLLLHGFPQTSTSWVHVAERLNGLGYRTIAPDQRGYSPGARPRGRFAYRSGALVADVVALIDQLGGGPVHVVGHDWGAMVGWSLAARRPESVRTLTAVSVPHPGAFVGAVLSSNQGLRSWYMAAFQVPWLPELLVSRFPRLFDRLLVNFGMDPDQLAEVHERIVDGGALTGAVNWYRAMVLTTPRALWRKVGVPTVYVWSDHDAGVDRRGADLTARFATGPYRLEVLAGADHWIPEHRPDELADIITDHLASPPSR